MTSRVDVKIKRHRRLLHPNTSVTNMVDIYDGRATHRSVEEIAVLPIQCKWKFAICRFPPTTNY